MLGGGGGNEAGSKEASSSSGFRILVTDTYCLSILNSVCLLQEIQEANILGKNKMGDYFSILSIIYQNASITSCGGYC